jgi:hypothetical protein
MANRLAVALAFAALGCASTLDAHHSSSLFDFARPQWVKGKVVSYVPGNPHTMIALEQRDDRGEMQRLSIEGPILARLGRMSLPADFLKAGDVIEICSFPYKNEGFASSRDAAALPALHGHVVVLPDGRLQPWSPYGKLDNCIRPNDAVEPWVTFVNTEPMAHEYWCNSRVSPRTTSIAPEGFVDEINRRLASPCD